MTEGKIEVIFAAAEVQPFSKVGGLGDVCGTLPEALARRGLSVTVLTPAYRNLDYQRWGIIKDRAHVIVQVVDQKYRIGISQWHNPYVANHKVVFLEHQELFGSRNVYTTDQGDPYPDNSRRFVVFQKAALAWMREQERPIDIVHCHDNHTALIPVYLKTTLADCHQFINMRSVLTLHNIAYQGLTGMEERALFDLPAELFYPLQPLEWYGRINPLKGGIVYADVVTTVSPTHAREIMEDEELSAGLRGVLKSRPVPVVGILNGVDYTYWNPETDQLIFKNYSQDTLSDKFENKTQLLRQIGLPAEYSTRPLIGIVSRLVEHKGIPLLLEAIPAILEAGYTLVVLGSGQAEYERALRRFQEQVPERIYYECGYNERFAHQIMAAADFFLMPSRFEPCGMTQLYALRYGTVPIVHKTGGLADTVQDWDGTRGTGFCFHPFSAEALNSAIRRAAAVYASPALDQLRRNGMVSDFSWEKSAHEYHRLYLQVMGKLDSEVKDG